MFLQDEIRYIGLAPTGREGELAKEDLKVPSRLQSSDAAPPVSRIEQFKAECIELILSSPDHKIEWKQFWTCYHERFKRWCSIKYYGFANYTDLFEAVSEAVVVFHQGEKEYLGLTRKARDIHLSSKELNCGSGKKSITSKSGNRTENFAQECVELIMSTSHNKILWEKFRFCYHDKFGRWLNTKYVGYDTIEELFEAVSETVIVFWQGKHKFVGLSRTARDRHLDGKEVEPVSGQDHSSSMSDVGHRRFATECIELLMSKSEHKISFGDFASNYHRHFGRQIKVNEFGHEKLIELLEAVNDTVKISSEGDNHYVGLTLKALHRYLYPNKESDGASGTESPVPVSGGITTKLFAKECAELVMSTPDKKVALNEFSSSYRKYFGRSINLSDYGHEKLINLLEAVDGTLKLFWSNKTVSGKAERFVGLTHSARQLHLFGQELVELLEAQPLRSLRLEHFASTFTRHFGRQFKPATYKHEKLRDMLEELPHIVQVSF